MLSEMIDHVTIRVPDLAEARRFYGLALELLAFPGEPVAGGGFVEWNDFSITGPSADRPATRRLHIGFSATSNAMVDGWWAAMTGAGHPSDGEPGRGRSTGPSTTAPSSSTPPGTASRRCTTARGASRG
jgi:catechol 2,3-dioxygenase-like lactoylglutathione lyase family enzyme